ncbi:MAG: SDR family NAD(P)-dependent oxidoreductase [Candidatus Peribacteria bacterium]|jgi:short-subunit dehydrogenase|nr:SDR family NAD(P)-dependent oxidoreductase [Candidatus Peribacteria bacterium]
MKRVIITGGSTGLGQELSKQFLQQGREVVCLSRTKPPLDVAHLETDFTDKGSIAQSVATLKKQYADFSVVICCAGIGYIEKLEEMNYEHTQAMFDVNLIGQSYLLSGLAEEIRHNVADLVFIGATIGFK